MSPPPFKLHLLPERTGSEHFVNAARKLHVPTTASACPPGAVGTSQWPNPDKQRFLWKRFPMILTLTLLCKLISEAQFCYNGPSIRCFRYTNIGPDFLQTFIWKLLKNIVSHILIIRKYIGVNGHDIYNLFSNVSENKNHVPNNKTNGAKCWQ